MDTTEERIDALVTAFRHRLDHTDPKLIAEMFLANDDRPRDFDDQPLDRVSTELAERAAVSILASAMWMLAIGPMIDTWEVTHRLNISRQAVADRVKHRSLLALPGRRSRRYPTWQFGGEQGIHTAVAPLLRRWFEAEPDVEPHTIAAWANAPSDLLDGVRPAHLVERGDDERALAAADITIHERTR